MLQLKQLFLLRPVASSVPPPSLAGGSRLTLALRATANILEIYRLLEYIAIILGLLMIHNTKNIATQNMTLSIDTL